MSCQENLLEAKEDNLNDKLSKIARLEQKIKQQKIIIRIITFLLIILVFGFLCIFLNIQTSSKISMNKETDTLEEIEEPYLQSKGKVVEDEPQEEDVRYKPRIYHEFKHLKREARKFEYYNLYEVKDQE